MAMNSEYRGSASGVAAPKKKAATRKTVATPGTKVSQATIDKIKAMGMTKALKSAGSASPEMREGIKRMYGASRFNAAVSSTKPYASKPVAKSADAARSAATGGAKYKSADSARRSATPVKPVAKSADAARMGAKTVMSPSNPNRQNMPYKTPGAKPVQKDMYGNKVKSGVTIGAKKKAASTPSKSKSGYKAPTQKDMYGNKIK